MAHLLKFLIVSATFCGLILISMFVLTYSDPYPWCEKASKEATDGSIVVGLLPDDRSTAWYREQVYPNASAIYITSRRVPFLDENGVPQNGNPKGSIVIVWTPWLVDSPAQGMIEVPRLNSKKGEWIYG